MLWRRKFTNTAVVYFLLVVVLLVGSYRALRSPSPASPITQDGPDFWEWDTNTRFNNDNAVRNGKKHSLCDAFPADVLSQIQVVLKIGSSEPSDRIDTQISTVTQCIPNILIVSDQDSELHGHHVHDVLESIPESFRNNTPEFEAHDAIAQGQPPDAVDDRLGWNLDRFKFLPMVEKAYRLSPSAKWFVFLESDTYFVWDNLFRLLDKFDPWTPWYMGSPSPGRHTKNDEVTWFAYGGAGFVLSIGALEKLFAQSFWSSKASLSEQYEELVKTDNCGDSVLGWVLHEKGVKLTGLWPMFNAHALNGVPFGPHWCQPVISLHKTLLPDMEGLVKWENQRGWKEPLLYADLFDYLKMGTFDHKHDWDNADWGGWQEPPESPAHASLKACGKTCHENPQCLSYTYNSSGHCFFIPTVRLGSRRSAANPKDKSTAGWDVRKIQSWRTENQCKNPQWMKPSITRIF